MSIPPITSPIWEDILTEKKKINFEFFAISIFMGRVRMQLSRDPNSVEALAAELRSFIEKNENHPAIKKDLEKING